jgi:hypothetical protein
VGDTRADLRAEEKQRNVYVLQGSHQRQQGPAGRGLSKSPLQVQFRPPQEEISRFAFTWSKKGSVFVDFVSKVTSSRVRINSERLTAYVRGNVSYTSTSRAPSKPTDHTEEPLLIQDEDSQHSKGPWQRKRSKRKK